MPKKLSKKAKKSKVTKPTTKTKPTVKPKPKNEHQLRIVIRLLRTFF